MGKLSETKNAIKFSALKLEQSVFEIRSYNRQVFQAIIPDFWEAIEERLGKPVVYTNQDAGSVCLFDKSVQLSIEQERFSVLKFNPEKSLAKFIQTSSDFYETVREFLRMERITRAGFRLIYSLDFDDPTSVAQAFLSLPFISVPENLSLSKKGKPLIPTYYVGWNDGKKVIVYRLKGNASKLSVDLPLQLSLSGEHPSKIEKVYNQFIFDVDVYISEPILPDEFLPAEWLNQAYETVQSDGISFFGE